MKKVIYIILAGAALMTAACQKQGTIYQIPAGSACASFPSDAAKIEMLASDGNKITVEMWRGNTKGAASVAVNIEDKTGGVFTPSKQTFDFADGQAVATIDFTYPDINDFGGETYKIDLVIADPDQVSPAGIAKMTVSAQRKLTPKYVCTGTYYSDWYEDEWEQDLYTTEEAPDLYIFPDCWVRGTDFMFNMVNGKPVWPDSFFSGYVHSSYGNVNIYPEDSYIEDGVLYLEVKAYRVSAGSFGGGIEYFVLPEGFSF